MSALASLAEYAATHSVEAALREKVALHVADGCVALQAGRRTREDADARRGGPAFQRRPLAMPALGALGSMKAGKSASPWRYDAARDFAPLTAGAFWTRRWLYDACVDFDSGDGTARHAGDCAAA